MVNLKKLLFRLALPAFIIQLYYPRPVYSKGQFVQPLNMGMQMAIPYDIANIFNRPVAGVTSVILTVALAIIIFFGIITSPFGYMFGIPSRKYVMGGEPEKSPVDRRSFSSVNPNVLDFLDRMLYLMPEEANPSCRFYVICYAHGALKHLSLNGLKFYKYFSEKLIGTSDEFREAFDIGLSDNSFCKERYKDCSKPIFSMLIKTLVNWLPERARKKTQTRQQNY